MKNGSFKTLLGWFIVTSQILLIAAIFITDAAGKLEDEEFSAAIAATVPVLGTYFSAVVLYFLQQDKSRAPSGWAAKPASINAVVISLLLPFLLFAAAIGALVMAAAGWIGSDKFGNYMMYMQTAQTTVSGLIYGNLFRKELEAEKRRRDREREPTAKENNPGSMPLSETSDP